MILPRKQCRLLKECIRHHRQHGGKAYWRGFSGSSGDDSLPDDVRKLIEQYVKKNQTSTSLETLMKTGRGELLSKTFGKDHKQQIGILRDQREKEKILMQVAGFIHHEMPIRLAHRIHDLDRVPMMRDMPSVQAVKKIYIDSFLELFDRPKIQSHQDEEDFAGVLESLYEKHANVLIQMAKGAYELREAVRMGRIQGTSGDTGGVEFARMDECHSFLDRFYMSRIGIRVLAGQYLALRDPDERDGYIGMICLETSPYDLVQHAATDAAMMCERSFNNVAPHVHIEGRTDLTFPYLPSHLHYILLELLKNGMRATMEKHYHDGLDEDDVPHVTVIIADGKDNEDVIIKVMDEGGGIPRSQTDKIWSYLYTTASSSVQEAFIGEKDHGADSPLAGLGYGLPISRSYARYFGGDLDIMSMEGYGTDAFVYLTRLGNYKEPLL